jgi:hypothetical protein
VCRYAGKESFPQFLCFGFFDDINREPGIIAIPVMCTRKTLIANHVPTTDRSTHIFNGVRIIQFAAHQLRLELVESVCTWIAG